jgi:hypothetical protein
MDGSAKQLSPQAMRDRLREGRLPCAEAFALAHEQGLAPLAVATAAEAQGVRIGWCQLGLFDGGKKHGQPRPAASVEVSPGLRAAIEEALADGQLPCARAWGIARRLGLERLAVGRAADALGIRVGRCQLGCF